MKKLLVSLLLLVSSVASAANVGIMPTPTARFWNSSGTAVLSGGYVVTCPEGTTCGCTSYTDKTTYTDFTGQIANSNPVYLDSRGEASIWLDVENGAYKITICDRFGTLQKSTDGVVAITQVTQPTVEVWQLLNLTPTFLSATSFSVLGDYTSTFVTGRRLKIIVTAGTIYSTVSTVGSSYSGGATTVYLTNDSTVLDSGLSSVYISILDNKVGLTTNTPGTLVQRDSNGQIGNIITAGTISSSGTNTWSGLNTHTGSAVFTGPVTLPSTTITGAGAGSGLDADKLDGMQPATTNTASTIVQRDGSGNFAAGTITASLTGNVTGNVSGSSGSCTGNSATASVLNGSIMGATNSTYTIETVYQCSTDILIFAEIVQDSILTLLLGYSDAANPPSTLIARAGTEPTSGVTTNSITFYCKKGQYWKVSSTNTPTSYFINTIALGN